MPLLSDKANIEYGPNSIFGISQKMQTIALKNLENSAENADIAQSKRPIDLKQFYEEFLSALVDINVQFKSVDSYIKKLVNKLAKWSRERNFDDNSEFAQVADAGDVLTLMNYLFETRRGGPKANIRNIDKLNFDGSMKDVDEPKIGEAFIGQSRRTDRRYPEDFLEGSGRKKKIVGKYNPRFTDRFTGRPEPHSWLVADVNGEQMTGGKKRKGRKSAKNGEQMTGGMKGVKVHPAPEDLESSDEEAPSVWGTVGSNSSYRGRAGGDPDSDPEDSDSSSDEESDEESRSNFSSNPSELSDPNNDDAEAHAEDEFSNWDDQRDFNYIRDQNLESNPLLYLLTKLISLVSRTNILFNGRIKKNINYFDRLDVQDMADKIDQLRSNYNSVHWDVVSIYLDNGEDIVGSLGDALNKLYLDVTIAVKSYAPSAQSGGSISGGSLQKMGFQEFYKNCPTKYLL